jgi:hypothetical protein
MLFILDAYLLQPGMLKAALPWTAASGILHLLPNNKTLPLKRTTKSQGIH